MLSLPFCSLFFSVSYFLLSPSLLPFSLSPSFSPSSPPSCKFEEKEDRVPKLEQLNALGFMCSLNLTLSKRDLTRTELLLLETFGWNLCMPTPAHFIDYYLHAAVHQADLHNGWPLSSLSKTKAFMDKYTHYFLEVARVGDQGWRAGLECEEERVQRTGQEDWKRVGMERESRISERWRGKKREMDRQGEMVNVRAAVCHNHAFLSFRPSQVAAACIAASRICLQIAPSWSAALQLLTGYSWDHLTRCIELMLLAHDNDVKEANKTKSSPLSGQALLQSQATPTPPSSSSSSTASPSQQLVFQAGPHPHLSQRPTPVPRLQAVGEPQTLGPSVVQDYLQSLGAGPLPDSAPAVPFHPYPSLASGLRSLPLQAPVAMQVSVSAEPRHCLGVAYGGGYLGSHPGFATGCFDRREPPPPTRSVPHSDSTPPPSRHRPPPPSLRQRQQKRKRKSSKASTDPSQVIVLT
ncbi:hypothetical protein JZ751_007168 [Albula glossodonta]|uniref:Cyclin C-terminal domain-containing protein n=1 Tax=Albula glossodonta TaxID=121402 RepID=A0A8T2PB11_9TELE|nr:hypothetical protein JZ751_007168 [Albula glossodonta]